MRRRKHYFRATAFLMAVLLLSTPGMSVCAETIDFNPTVNIGQEISIKDHSQSEKENSDAGLEDDSEKSPEKDVETDPEEAEKDSEDDAEKNLGEESGKDPEDDEEKEPEEESGKGPEDDVEENPEEETGKDPEDDEEENPEEETGKDPEDDEEKNPEEETGKGPEDDVEENPEEETGKDSEDDEEKNPETEVDEDELTNKVLSDEKALISAELKAPNNLQLDNADIFSIVLTWDAVEGADIYEVYYAVDPALTGNLGTDAYKLLGTTEENTYKSNLSENEVLNPEHEFNHYPVEKQYYSYRVKAVRRQSADQSLPSEQGEKSPFSEPVSANGMYVDSLPYINSKRKAYKLPGSGDYVRFYLGNKEGEEYNEANPIRLHEGESIDGLTLWAVCEDGSRVSYCKIRDAIAAYEKSHEAIAGNYKFASYAETYGFTWFIAERLSRADHVFGTESCISSLIKYAGNTVPDQLGFKAENTTQGTGYLAVALNNSLPPEYGSIFFEPKNAMCFEFFVPVVIEEAEEGEIYEDLDSSTICDSGEALWQTARRKIHDREKEFILLLGESAYNAFLDEYGYRRFTEWNGSMHEDYVSLADDKIVDTWLFTKYAEKEWMEPWAGDNLQDCIRNCMFSGDQILVNGTYYHSFKWSAEYYTTAEQEKELDAAIEKLLAEGGALYEARISDNPLKKIRAAFDYTTGIMWVDGTENPLNYTVYSAILLRKGSCESFSLTFVRLCREMGIQARVVKDDYWGRKGSHAWNIVEYRGLWYYVDCTNVNKFMKGSSGFNPGDQLPIYSEKEFTDSHPISKTDYALKKVTYYLNGGTNAPGNPVSYEPGDILTFAAPVKAGNTFEGWFADKSFRTRVTGPEGGTFNTSSLTGALNLYAKWKTNEYTLIYNMNVPEGAVIKKEGSINDVTVKYNASVRLAANTAALYKYKFKGWNTAADGSGVAYNAGAAVKNLVTSGSCILYAQWIPTTYTVKYDSNASSLGLTAKGKTANTVMTFYSETNKTAMNAFKINGYEFTGWATRADGRGLTFGQQKEADGTVSGAAVIGTALETVYAKDTNAAVVLYAQWKAVPYTVKLYRNDGGIETEPAQNISVNTGELLSSKSETAKIIRNGYTLSSWNTKADGKGKKYALNAKNLAKPGETITLYAQWSRPITYKITYDLQGGKNAAGNPKSYTAASTTEQRMLRQSTKVGSIFVKWVDAEEENPDTATGIETIPNEFFRNIKLRAVWRENSYQVTYHGADEKYTSVTDPVTKTYRYSELVDTFAPAKEFALKEEINDKVSISAWTTQPNGRGKSFAAGKHFSKLSAFNFDDPDGRGKIDLYAVWGPAVYKITYENCSADDGVRHSAVTSYVYNTKKNIPVKSPVRTGYIFAGWTEPSGKDYFDHTRKRIKAGTAEDVVLTANWMPITYAVKLNLNVKDKGVSFKTDAQIVYGDTQGTGIAYEYDTEANGQQHSFKSTDVLNEIPEYYELVGWNTKANGKGIAADCTADSDGMLVELAGLGKKNKGTVNLYAIWKPRTYTITYRHIDPEASEEELTGVKVKNPESYTYNASRAVKLKKPARYGFVFEGWYRKYNAVTGEYTDQVTSIPKGCYGNIILYGKWRVK